MKTKYYIMWLDDWAACLYRTSGHFVETWSMYRNEWHSIHRSILTIENHESYTPTEKRECKKLFPDAFK